MQFYPNSSPKVWVILIRSLNYIIFWFRKKYRSDYMWIPWYVSVRNCKTIGETLKQRADYRRAGKTRALDRYTDFRYCDTPLGITLRSETSRDWFCFHLRMKWKSPNLALSHPKEKDLYQKHRNKLLHYVTHLQQVCSCGMYIFCTVTVWFMCWLILVSFLRTSRLYSIQVDAYRYFFGCSWFNCMGSRQTHNRVTRGVTDSDLPHHRIRILDPRAL
jgi:hypothetical protein